MKKAMSLLVAVMLISGGLCAQDNTMKKSEAKAGTETTRQKMSGKECCKEGCARDTKDMKAQKHAKGEKCGGCCEKEAKAADTKTAPEKK